MLTQLPQSKQFTKMLLTTTAAISSLLVPSTNAQSNHAQSSPTTLPNPIVCHVTIPLQPDTLSPKLTYRLTGIIPASIAPDTPQNPIDDSLHITVQEQGNNIKTLLKRATLNEYGMIAPDANYAKLPFTGGFRAKPNNPTRLYSASGSSKGLFVSLRPLQGQVNQVQVVHYLSTTKFLRGQGKCRSTIASKLAPIQIN